MARPFSVLELSEPSADLSIGSRRAWGNFAVTHDEGKPEENPYGYLDIDSESDDGAHRARSPALPSPRPESPDSFVSTTEVPYAQIEGIAGETEHVAPVAFEHLDEAAPEGRRATRE